MRDKQTKNITLFRLPTIPTIHGTVIEEVRTIFAPPKIFWSDQ